jgi:hypothetical protein
VGRRSASLACCLVASTPPKGTYHFLPGTLRCVIDSVEDASLSCPPPPFPVAPWRARETPPPFRGVKPGVWVFTLSPHPVGCGSMGGERSASGGGRSQAPSAPGLL